MNNAISPATAVPPQLQGTAAAQAQPVRAPEPVTPAPAVAESRPAPQEQRGEASARTEQSRRELKETIERLNEQMRKNNFDLNFSVDDTTNVVVVKVKNAHSGDIVRQIPSETVLRVAHNLEAVKGLLRDEEA